MPTLWSSPSITSDKHEVKTRKTYASREECNLARKVTSGVVRGLKRPASTPNRTSFAVSDRMSFRKGKDEPVLR